MQVLIKDPDAILDYPVDWSDWLEEGEIIIESDWIVEDGIEIGDGTTGQEPQHTDTATTAWIYGGTAGEDYVVTNRIRTSEQRVDDRSRVIKVRDR